MFKSKLLGFGKLNDYGGWLKLKVSIPVSQKKVAGYP